MDFIFVKNPPYLIMKKIIDYRQKTISVLHLKADSINIRSYRTLCRKRLSASNKEKENQNSNPIFFSEKFKMKLSATFQILLFNENKPIEISCCNDNVVGNLLMKISL